MFQRCVILIGLTLACLCSPLPAMAQAAAPAQPAAEQAASEDGAAPADAALRAELRAELDDLGHQKAELLERLDALRAAATAGDGVAPARAEALLVDLVDLRDHVHRRFDAAFRAARRAERPVAVARAELAQARRALDAEQRRQAELGDSEVWRARVAQARQRVEDARARLTEASALRDLRAQHVQDLRAHLAFFTEPVAQVVGWVSPASRRAFFAVDEPERWRQAWLNLENGLRSVALAGRARVASFERLEADSVELWTWLWGLAWRLVLLAAMVRVAVPIWRAIVDRLIAAMLRRPFLRRHATATVKLGELLHAVALPAAAYAGVVTVARYLAVSLAELQALVWMVDAIFIYWMGVAAVRTFALPRWHRHARGDASASPFEPLAEDEIRAVSDLIVLELPRARKLVRSARVIIVFWLLAVYVPDFARPITGITVLWWTLDALATWGFIGVVYWVLSQWRDEIAAVFDRLAGDRLSRVADFVEAHKNRPWGVLVIGAAAVYVLVVELILITRRYVVRTDWAKRLRSFLFRTSIEMQERKRADGAAADGEASAGLPDDYLARFAPEPLTADDPRIVPRTGDVASVRDEFDRWLSRRRQGSVMLVGEPGSGKTTTLGQIEVALAEAAELPVVRVDLDQRLYTPADVIEALADAFGLPSAPADAEALVAQLREIEPRAVLVDDCHHAFSRQIEGFDSLETLLDVVNLCDETHFFVLAFNLFTWNYAERVLGREHYFGHVRRLEPFSEADIQALIDQRDRASAYTTSFATLATGHRTVDQLEYAFELVQTAQGYFRYLHEFCRGNPAVALVYWLRSLRLHDADAVMQVGLFARPATEPFARWGDDHWFLLSALAQHGEMDLGELAEVVHVSPGFCQLALDYFCQAGVVGVDWDGRRAWLTPLYLRQVIKHLVNSNFLYR